MIAMGLGAVGSLMDVFAANQQKKAAIESGKRVDAFALKQRASTSAGFDDLISKAGGLDTYKADTSLYKKAVQETEMQKRMAGSSRVAGIGIAQDKVKQSTADALAAGRLGSTSSSDVLTLAALTQGTEASKMSELEQSSMAYSQSMQDRANQSYLQAIGEQATATARERGLEFESKLNKQKTIMGLEQSKFQGLSDLDMNLFGMQQTAFGNVAAAKSAFTSGIGGIATEFGKGLLNIDTQNQNRLMMERVFKA